MAERQFVTELLEILHRVILNERGWRSEVSWGVHFLEDVGHLARGLHLSFDHVLLGMGDTSFWAKPLFNLFVCQERLGHNSWDFLKILQNLWSRILLNLRGVTLHRLSTTVSSRRSLLLRCQKEAVRIILVQCVFRALLATNCINKRDFFAYFWSWVTGLVARKVWLEWDDYTDFWIKVSRS